MVESMDQILLRTRNIFILILAIAGVGCRHKQHCQGTALNSSLIDSLKNHSDTSYTKKYRPNEFATVEYFLNRKDSTVGQLMKDSAGTTRQIIFTKRSIRTYYAEFYSNGQLKATLLLDSAGNYHGSAIYYFENGCVKSKGKFHHGLYAAEWKNYDSKGKLVYLEEYDNNGQLIKTKKLTGK
jgi:antitoxin component YwqK of YwqJK toxin-antitoxin module